MKIISSTPPSPHYVNQQLYLWSHTYKSQLWQLATFCATYATYATCEWEQGLKNQLEIVSILKKAEDQ